MFKKYKNRETKEDIYNGTYWKERERERESWRENDIMYCLIKQFLIDLFCS
jgi:hypothetical protein